jgi:hypothetical protein
LDNATNGDATVKGGITFDTNTIGTLTIAGSSLERVLKVPKTALKPSEHQIHHSNMNEGSA